MEYFVGGPGPKATPIHTDARGIFECFLYPKTGLFLLKTSE